VLDADQRDQRAGRCDGARPATAHAYVALRLTLEAGGRPTA